MSGSPVSGTAHRVPRVADGLEREARAGVGGQGGGGVLRSAGCRCSGVGGEPLYPVTLASSGPSQLVLGRGFESHHAKAQACSAGNTWWRLEEVAPGDGCRGTWVTLGPLAGGRHMRKGQSCFLFGY